MSGIQSVSVSAAQTYASVGSQSQQSLQPFANLDLTEAQRTQLRSIFTAAKHSGSSPSDVQQQVDSVLSPAQQKTLAQDIRGGHQGHRRHTDAEPSTNDGSASSTAAQPTAAPASSTVLAAVTNVQNQVSAANSTLLETLQQNILAGTDTTAINTPTTS